MAGILRRVFAFRTWLAIAGGVLPVSLVIIFGFLVIYAWPAIGFNGLDFLTQNGWDPGDNYSSPVMLRGVMASPGAHFGVLFLIVGTLCSVILAVAIAYPFGVAAAVFLAEIVPGAIRSFVSFFVELLAAVPSVVFGLWGIGVISAFPDKAGVTAFQHVCNWIVATPPFEWIPFVGGDPGNGYGLLAAGVILAFMIVPLITSTVRDALIAQPAALREASVALGARRFETIVKVLLPSVRPVTIGATILATGRALGETMAVLMVCGNALGVLPKNLFAPISTMASFIASQLDSAGADTSGLVVKSLAEVAIILGLMSLVVNTGARVLLAMQTASQRERT
ncbi:MAG TPA: phosphate ABC transporter permease subunit PstC [Caulobacteraceae bacterium]|nr:phosphate ABC transporter permease subunit PstC [Caulobacteraceae bacterium]HEX4097711.1 phosphate ABC transporter permease subunit PstC [Caulobacteraceae bacterium]